jgi:hypothetical protein
MIHLGEASRIFMKGRQTESDQDWKEAQAFYEEVSIIIGVVSVYMQYIVYMVYMVYICVYYCDMKSD